MTLKLSRELMHAILHELRGDPEIEGLLPVIPHDIHGMPPQYELPVRREKVIALDRAIKKGIKVEAGYFGTLTSQELLAQWNAAIAPFLDPL